MTDAARELQAIAAARLPMATRSLLGDDVRSRHGLGSQEADGMRRRFDPAAYRDAADQAAAELRSARSRDGIGLGVLHANRYLILGTLGAATIMFPPVGVPAQLAMAATTVLLEDGTSALIDQFREGAEENGRRLLSRHLAELRTRFDGDLSQLASLPVEEAKARLTQMRGGVFDAIESSGLDREDEGIVAVNLVQALERAMTARASLDALADQAQDVRLDEVVGTQRALIRFQNVAEKRLVALETGLQAMDAELKEIAQSTRRTQADVQFLTELAFGRMSAKEQLEALQRGMMHQLVPTERASLQKRLQVLARREEVVETAGKFLNGVGIMVQVAQGLNINPRLVGKVAEMTKVATAAINTFSALASGNFLGAAGVVAGALFGGGDPAAARHQQIMSALEDLKRGQQQIMQQLDAVLRNQQTMLENQQRIYQAILDLSRDVWENHRAVMRELGALRDEVLVNRVILQDIQSEPVEQVEQFLEKRRRFPSFDRGQGRFKSYADMADHFDAFGSEFRSGAIALRNMIGQRRPQVDPLFRLQTYVREGEASADLLRAYANTADLFRALVPKDQRPSAVERLLLPSGTWREATRTARLPERPAMEEDAFLIANLGMGVSAERVYRIGRMCLPLATYFDIVRSPDDRHLPAVEALLSHPRRTYPGQLLLEDMLLIIRLAIAEASLMAGEVILAPTHELVVSGLKRGRASNGDPRGAWRREERLAVDAILDNHLLRTNWVRWMVRQHLNASGFDAFAYDGAVKTSLDYLKEMLPGPWTLAARSNPAPNEPKFDLLLPSWTGTEVPIALPGGEDVMRPELARDPEMSSLMHVRDEVLAALTGYTLLDRVPPRTSEVLKELSLWRRVA